MSGVEIYEQCNLNCNLTELQSFECYYLMRIFLRFSVALFRNKTERIQIEPTATTDELLEIVSKRINKPAGSFTLTYVQEQIRVRVIKGWHLSHYNIRPGSTLHAQLNEQSFQIPTDSMKTNKLLATLIPTADLMQLSRVEEVSEEHLKDSVGEFSFKEVEAQDDDAILRSYLDQQLELMMKEAKKGNVVSLASILEENQEFQDRPDLLEKLNYHKKANFINELGEKGWAAIHVAMHSDQAEVLDFLMSHHADPNLWTSDGWTPLQLAVSKRSINCVKTLLSCPRVNVNEVTPRGTALHVAAKLDLTDMVKLLLDYKANEHLPDGNGDTPIQFTDNQEIIALLNRQEQKKSEKNQSNSFMQQLPPILKGQIYRQNTIYQMKQHFFVCNPFQGTLIRFQNEAAFPRKPIQVLPLVSINEIKMIRPHEKTWVMSKNYYHFEIFSQGRLILGTKNEKIAQRWVRGIFQASVFAIANEAKPNAERIDARDATTLVLDDNLNIIGNPAITVRPRANSQSPKRAGSSNLLKQLSSRGANTNQSPKRQIVESKPLVRAFTTTPEVKKSTATEVPPTIYQKRVSEEEPVVEEVIERNVSVARTEPQNTPNFSLFKAESPREESIPRAESSEKLKKQSLSKIKEPNSAKTTITTMGSQEQEQVAKVKFSSFELLKIIGSGAFGKVFEAKLKSTGQVFALKALHKKNLTLRRGFKYAISEAQILKQADHPFIVKLHYTFQTVNNLYMCMDYCSRGDLSQLIAQVQTLNEFDTVKIIAQIILAIEYLHTKNIIYRDLKPENMLLCEDGFIKLADFGLSKQLNEKNSCTTFCGSLAYLSPEMLQQKDVGKHSDVYGIGCVMYELLAGEPPYYDSDQSTLQSNIVQGKLKFTTQISPVAKQLILRFLQRDISKRITLQQAKHHPFFKDVDFGKLLEKKVGKIVWPKRQIMDSDDDDYQIKNPKPKFIDVDYPDNSVKAKVPNYSFAKIK